MRRVVLLAIVAFALSGVRAEANDPADAPAGLTPTTASLHDVLDKAAAAAGRLSPDVRSISETWTIKDGELGGAETYYIAGDDYRRDESFGKLHFSAGEYLGQRWSQDYDGYTVVESGLHTRSEANDRELRRAADGLASNSVTVIGESFDPQAFVVRVAPPDGLIEYRFYDKSSHLLVRRERAIENQRYVTTYADYQTVAGKMVAHHIHTSDGRPFNDVEEVLTSVTTDATDDASRLAIPPDRRDPVTIEGGRTVLPARIMEDEIILTAELGGHKVNLQLDSGAAGIFLDRSIADAVKLEMFGRTTQTTAGTYVASAAILPQLKFGGATLTDVAIETAPYVEWMDPKTPVAGLIGFDFIAGCVVEIDYEKGTVEAIDPAAFTPPSGAVALPIRLDDDVPVIEVRIGSTVASKFILDTGADRSTLFSGFVKAHPDEAADQGLGNAMMESFQAIRQMWGVGGRFSVRPIQVSSLGLGAISLPHWLFYATGSDARSFEGDDYDGLIGQDVLRNFTVYLDYRHREIYLLPNERFHQRYALRAPSTTRATRASLRMTSALRSG